MISLLDSHLYSGLFGIPDEIAAQFSDTCRVRDLLAVEVALARAEAVAGIIPPEAAGSIAAAAATLSVDLHRLRESITRSAVPVIELVRQLRAATTPQCADLVHRGATSQDVIDTAMVLATRRCTDRIRVELRTLTATLISLAATHRHSVMAGRTHGQHATPITFGYKVAGWLAPLVRHIDRLDQLLPRVLVVQLGGASGTLSGVQTNRERLIAAFAAELSLGVAPPWHTQRDGVVEYAAWLAQLTGSLGKIGQDIVLLSQTEIAEVRESADGARGGSSAMPHKENPIASEMLITAARLNAALFTGVQNAMVQEHERSTHGWQVEWFALPQMIALTAGALANANFVAANLRVDIKRMAANLTHAGGLVLSESLALALSEKMPLAEAQALVREASRNVTSETTLASMVRQAATARGVDDVIDWTRVADVHQQTGAAVELTDQILAAARLTAGVTT